MPYKGFTWNMTYAEARRIKYLLEHYVLAEDRPGYRVDRFLAGDLIAKATIFMELSPDGDTPTHGTADA